MGAQFPGEFSTLAVSDRCWHPRCWKQTQAFRTVQSRAMLGVMVGSFPTCLFCEGVIASDEPLIVVEHEGERKTSFAREPELAERGRGLFVHARCAPRWPTAPKTRAGTLRGLTPSQRPRDSAALARRYQ